MWMSCHFAVQQKLSLHCESTILKTLKMKKKNLKIELPYDSAIPLLGIYSEKTKSLKYMHPGVHSSIITIAKTWKKPKCP